MPQPGTGSGAAEALPAISVRKGTGTSRRRPSPGQPGPGRRGRCADRGAAGGDAVQGGDLPWDDGAGGCRCPGLAGAARRWRSIPDGRHSAKGNAVRAAGRRRRRRIAGMAGSALARRDGAPLGSRIAPRRGVVRRGVRPSAGPLANRGAVPALATHVVQSRRRVPACALPWHAGTACRTGPARGKPLRPGASPP